MKFAKPIVLIALAGALIGCAATKLDANPQEIAVSVMPAMASCDAYQAGVMVGRYDPTRGAMTVPKSSGRTDILCIAPGYKDKRISLAAGDDEPRRYRRYLVDFGLVRPLGYPGNLQILMEPENVQHRPD